MEKIDEASEDFYLAKFCKPEHNVLLGCNTLRLGTLNYYKTLDPSFYPGIADSEEGTILYSINRHLIGDPRTTQEVKHLINGFVGGNSPYVSIQNCEMTVRFPNCYVFCCQMVDKEPLSGDGLQFDKSYTSHFSIPNPAEFCEYLGDRLNEQMETHNFSPKSGKHLEIYHKQQRGEPKLSAWHGPVQYVPTKSRELTGGQLNYLMSNIPTELQPAFFKSEKFSLNREYRFVYSFHFDDKGLEVQDEPLDLQTSYRAKLRRTLRLKNKSLAEHGK